MTMTAFSEIVSSFGALKDIAQAMIGLHDAQALQTKVIEFNSKLIDTQQLIFSINEDRTTLIERVRDFEKQIIDLKAWDTEKQRYELKQLSSGSFAYAIKPSEQHSEPAHYICANCYQNNEKRILQKQPHSLPEQHMHMPEMYACSKCSEKIIAA